MSETDDAIEDLRPLVPPGPLERILGVIAEGPGPWRFLLAWEPFPLYPILRADGFRYNAHRDERGVVLEVRLPDRIP